MKKLILWAIAFAAFLAFVITPQNANAQQDIVQLTQKQAIVATVSVPTSAQTSVGVPPITCQYPTDCIYGYYGNGSLEGYAMLRHNCDGCKWVRTTRVNGADWDNTYVAPITCPQEDSCVRGHYYNAWTDEGYDMLRQRYGTIWVRTSMIERDGAVFN